MKRKLFFIVVFACCIKLFAASGLLAGEKDLKVVETKYFDIIYPARCEKIAAILYNNADRIFAEVTDFMCTSVEFRLPVVITPAVDQLNAFFSPVPYNHIVLYDTTVNGSENFAVFGEQFLNVFKHELTHAVTFNMKNSFWKGVGTVFGDVIDVGYLGISTGLAEGATLSSESSLGEGRLNDSYSTHSVKQSKIEGKFPKSSDVLGATTKTNVNHPYNFNGPFAKFLQDKYGMEAYSKYWYYIVNAQRLNAFKSAFGVSKETAWILFEESYEVPDIPSNPVASDLVQDFFEKDLKEYSKYNDEGSFYSSLTNSETRIAWIDKTCGKIYSVEKHNLNDNEIKPNKILQMNGVYSINLSNDGNYLAISTFSNNKSNTKAYVSILNLQTKQLYKIKEQGLRDGSIVCKDGQYYLVATNYETPNCVINIYKIQMNKKGRIIGVEKNSQVREPLDTFPGKYTALPTGEFALILKEKSDYSICVLDLDGTIIRKYNLPQNMVIRSLSLEHNDDNLFFSYAEPETLPRYGKLSLDTGKLNLSQIDLSGGVYYPVSDGKDIIYIGSFYEQNRLLRIENGTEIEDKKEYVLADDINKNENKDYGDSLFIANAKKFNPFKYYQKGVFFPASIYTTEYFGCNSGYSSSLNYSILGATYITANPWTAGTDDLSLISLGYNCFNNSIGMEISLQKGTASPILITTTDLKTEFDFKGWKQSGGVFELSSTIPFGKKSNFLLKNDSIARIGRQDLRVSDSQIQQVLTKSPEDMFGLSSSRTNTIYYLLTEVFSVGYSNIIKAGPGPNEKSGFTFQISAGYWYESTLENNPVILKNTFDMNAIFTAYIPKLLPFKNVDRCTWNLPTKLNAVLFPTSSNLGYSSVNANTIGRSLFDYEIETVLFAYEIQKALPFLSAIYANNITFTGGYAGSLPIPIDNTCSGFQMLSIPTYLELIQEGVIKYYDSFYLKFAMALSPNLGTLSGLGMFNFYAQISFPVVVYEGVKGPRVAVGINGGF